MVHRLVVCFVGCMVVALWLAAGTALAAEDDIDEIVANQALQACKADQEIINSKRLKKCAAVFDAMLIFMEHMEGQNDFAVYTVDAETVREGMKKPKIAQQIEQGIQMVLADVRANPKVTTDDLVERYRGMWSGIKHSIFTAHLNIPEPQPVIETSDSAEEPAEIEFEDVTDAAKEEL